MVKIRVRVRVRVWVWPTEILFHLFYSHLPYPPYQIMGIGICLPLGSQAVRRVPGLWTLAAQAVPSRDPVIR